MSRNLDSEIVRKHHSEIRKSTAADLARIRARRAVDTSDVPESDLNPDRWLKGDAAGSRLRHAIALEVQRRGISRYQLWKLAKKRCSTLPESAINEFLNGKRDVGLKYLDAMLGALELFVVPRNRKQ